MRRLSFVAHAVVVPWLCATPVFAQSGDRDDVDIRVSALGTAVEYPVVKRGQLVVVNAQRFVVTHEPAPVASIGEAPPPPLAAEDQAVRPAAPSKSAVWVAGHWVHGADGFIWVSGRYVAARAGHIFVPPRWALDDTRYLFFSGFYVPYGVYVRSHFNRYYYADVPGNGTRVSRGPYWPIGAPGPVRGPVRSATRRDPYWPVGAPR